MPNQQRRKCGRTLQMAQPRRGTGLQAGQKPMLRQRVQRLVQAHAALRQQVRVDLRQRIQCQRGLHHADRLHLLLALLAVA